MSENPETVVAANETTTKNGEENFNDEIKDYAKTTMNELLGMFGYDEEITRESVDSLEIKVPSSSEESSNVSGTTTVNVLPSSSVAMVTAQTTSDVTTTPVTVTPSLPLTVPEDSEDDTPVIVKVEGNTSVNDIIRQQNAGSKTSNSTGTTSTVSSAQETPATQTTSPAIVTTQASQSLTVPTTQSENGQPALQAKKTAVTGFTKPSTTNTTPVGKAASKNLSPYLSSTVQTQASRPCTWCKKSTVLKNFTFRDGTRILECRNICSQECFEMAALSIELNNENIKSIQRRIRQLRETKASALKSTVERPTPGTPSATTSRPAKKDKRLLPLFKPLFNWENYLKDCGAKGAPLSYFKQSSTPPHNGFKPGMKLEVSDPRVVKSTCLATVVGSIGPRVRFQFDGTDKSNDVWHMVDSTEIHPVGWCEANGGQLQPPVGFVNDPGRYQKFVAVTLAAAGQEKIAPARVFKKPPGTPDKNMFEPGMKLEAVDPKNQVLVCVATVGEVDGDRVRIDFDGYMGSDYWCRYDSRSIFPVGWSALNGHPLQPPGKKKRANMANLNRCKTKEDEPHTKKPKLTSPTTKSPSSSSSSASSSTQTVSSSPGNSTDDASSRARAQPSVVLYVNHGCRVGRYLDKDKVARLRGPWIGNNNVNIVLQSCIQALVNCATNQKKVFGFLKPGNGRAKITARSGSEILSCNLQFVDRVRLFWKVLDKFLEKLTCCDNLISTTKIKGRCDKCHGKAVPRTSLSVKNTPSITESPVTPEPIPSDSHDVSSPQVCSTSPAKTWSVDEVIKYIESTELADHVSLFKIHEIDGRALLLLNRDMIMSYMGLKLGPAIKLLNIVHDLKPKEIVEVE